MSPDQLNLIWIAIISLFGTVIVAIIGGFFMLKGIEKRAPSQNFLEDMQGRKIAQEIIDNYEKNQLEDREEIKKLKEQVSHLTEILDGIEYEQTTVSRLRLGKVPIVLSSDTQIVSVK